MPAIPGNVIVMLPD